MAEPTIPRWSDLTGPQRRLVRQLAEAEIADPPAYVDMPVNKLTIRKLANLDLIVSWEMRHRITSRGLRYYHIVLASPPGHLSDDDYRKIIQMGKDGMTQYAIADKIGCTQAFVSTVLLGKTRRARKLLSEMHAGPQRRSRRHKDGIRRRVIEMRRAGASYEDIIVATGVPMATVGTWIRRAGLLTEGHLSHEDKRRIVQLACSGLTYYQIAQRIGRSVRPVKDVMQAYYQGRFDPEGHSA